MKAVKILLSIFFVVLMFTNVSFSQSIPSGTARFEALGYNPFLWDASIDINRNPAWAGYYHNYTFGDIGRDVINDFQLSSQFGAVNFGVSKDVSLGMVLNKREDRWNEFVGTGGFAPSVAEPIVPFKLLFAYATKDFSLGLAPYIASWKMDSTINSVDQEWSSMVLGGTIGTVIKFDKNLFEGAVDVKINSYEYTNTDTNIADSKTDGGLQLGAFLRGKFYLAKGSSIAFVPYASFGMFNWTPNTGGVAGNEIKNMDFAIGAGINMPVLDDGLMMGGLSFGYSTYQVTDAFEYSSMRLPQFNLGLEWGFTDWLTGRLGYSRAVFSDKVTVVAVTPNNVWNYQYASDATQTITMGLGLNFGRFSIDGTIGERLLKQGPYVFTGQSNDLFGMISASYNFKK
ncbi:MAG: hypothetical protein JW917_07045 [Ignavibacteria bacterium]|nr:hypothetical protein [Ignavibacteria bacterium]